ncbi:hypothetical protein [Kitasatospora phosalacinea]|uniref:hypothetical protein n=1 Tax=Kitasatospora phosalacinea TaxID=2065 RepID=UPI0009DCBD45|nr:hypothetical protein [Kitasatospora phosalacinea]
MRRRVMRAAAAGLLAAAAMAGTVPAAQAATDPAAPSPKCQLPAPTTVADRQTAGWKLTGGQSLAAKDGKAVLTMEPDGNLVLYLVNSTGGPNHPIWSTGTWGHPGAYGLLQDDGNFVVYQAGGGPETGGALWSSGTWGQPGATLSILPGALLIVGTPGKLWSTSTFDEPSAFCPGVADSPGVILSGSWTESASAWLILQRDGNLVMYRKRDDKAIWSTNTWGHERSTLRMQDDGNLVLYPLESFGSWTNAIWSTNTGGHPGAYAILQDDGNFVVYQRDGRVLWASGTWGL